MNEIQLLENHSHLRVIKAEVEQFIAEHARVHGKCKTLVRRVVRALLELASTLLVLSALSILCVLLVELRARIGHLAVGTDLQVIALKTLVYNQCTHHLVDEVVHALGANARLEEVDAVTEEVRGQIERSAAWHVRARHVDKAVCQVTAWK